MLKSDITFPNKQGKKKKEIENKKSKKGRNSSTDAWKLFGN